MTSEQKLLRDIETVRTAIRDDWKEMAADGPSKEDRKNLRTHIAFCVSELAGLLAQLEQVDDA